MLEISAEYQAFYKKHPYFETDPVCRLARELCLIAIGEHADADRLVANAGYELWGGDIPLTFNIGPDQRDQTGKPSKWVFPDYLTAGNKPRPLWLAWYRQAEAAIAALKKIETADA